MKILVGVLLVLCLVEINGRHVDENEDVQLHDEDERTEFETRLRDHATQMRHRRRSRQSYGYDYSPPLYFDNRRDHNYRQQEEMLSHIVKSLDEVISYLRRPPPPPQPIYVPYPIVHYVPCGSQPKLNSTNENSTSPPDLDDRFGKDVDPNQLWGSSIIPSIYVDEGEDGSRPISFVPVDPPQPTSRPPPAVNHGSSQAGQEQTTVAPSIIPGICQSAILSCCSRTDTALQKACFTRYGCLKTYSSNRACDPDVIRRVLDVFRKAYGPVNK